MDDIGSTTYLLILILLLLSAFFSASETAFSAANMIRLRTMAEDGTTVEYAALNDHGYDWWTNEGKLVLEDPEYCASVSFTVGSWIEMLDKYSAG